MRKILSILLIVLLFIPADASAAKKRKKHHRKHYPYAHALYLWDTTANRAAYSKNINIRVYPASTTKVMTALLALERLPLDQYVTASSRSTQVQQTKLGFRAGDRFTVRNLVYAALLKSANDASIVLAEAVAGSQSDFVAMMNARARAIGAVNTRFTNPHGLPSKALQYTTARDMALIFREALKNPHFVKMISFKYRIIYSKDGKRYFLKSHNKSLFLNWKRYVYGKTGFTRQARSCFVGYYRKGQKTYIVSIFSSNRRWDDMKYIIEKYGGLDL